MFLRLSLLRDKAVGLASSSLISFGRCVLQASECVDAAVTQTAPVFTIMLDNYSFEAETDLFALINYSRMSQPPKKLSAFRICKLAPIF